MNGIDQKEIVPPKPFVGKQIFVNLRNTTRQLIACVHVMGTTGVFGAITNFMTAGIHFNYSLYFFLALH